MEYFRHGLNMPPCILCALPDPKDEEITVAQCQRILNLNTLLRSKEGSVATILQMLELLLSGRPVGVSPDGNDETSMVVP